MLQTTSVYGTTVNLVVAVLLLSVILFFIYTIVFSANRLFDILPVDLLPRNHPWFKRLGSAMFAQGTVSLVGFGLSLGLLVLLFLLSDNVTPVDALQLGLAGALLYVLYSAVGRPVQLRRQCSLRRPSESEAARLQSALEASGFDLDRVRVIELPEAENEDKTNHTPTTAGFGPFRRLYVPEPLFETYADEPLHALCATSVATWFRRYRTLITASWLTLAPSGADGNCCTDTTDRSPITLGPHTSLTAGRRPELDERVLPASDTGSFGGLSVWYRPISDDSSGFVTGERKHRARRSVRL